MITTVTADGKKEYEFIEFLKNRAQNSDKDVIPAVSEIIENVKNNGDRAVEYYTIKFDGKAPEKTEIDSSEQRSFKTVRGDQRPHCRFQSVYDIPATKYLLGGKGGEAVQIA